MDLPKQVFTLGVMFLIFFVLGAFLGHSDLFRNSISGFGSIEQRTSINDAFDVVSVSNGTINYRLHANWNDGTPLEFKSEIEMVVGAEDGLFTNKYSVGIYSNGYKHRLSATKIIGEFEGAATFTHTDVSLDSVIIMDAKGQAIFKGKVTSMKKNEQPLTASETLAIGKLTIEQILHIDIMEMEDDDWLGFCDEVSKGLPFPINITPVKN